jgi:hypothetical protein
MGANYDRLLQLMAAGEEPEVASIARRLTVTEILKHTATWVPTAVTAAINMAGRMKAWAGRGRAAAAAKTADLTNIVGAARAAPQSEGGDAPDHS